MIKSLKKLWNAGYNLGRAQPIRSGAALQYQHALTQPFTPPSTAASRAYMMSQLEEMFGPSVTTVMHISAEEWAPGLWAGTEGATLRIETVDLENRTVTVRFE